MAKRSTTIDPLQKVASNGQLVNMGPVNDPATPESYRDQVAQLYQNAVQDYNSGSFHARHPVASAGINVLIGALSGNPANMIGTPLLGADKEAKRKNSIVEAYQNAIKAAAYQQNQLNDTQMAANRGHGLNTLAGNAGYESPFGDYAQIDPTTFKNVLDGIMAGDTAQTATTGQEGAFKRGWNIGGRMYNSMQGQSQGGNQQAPSPQAAGPYLAASAMETGQSSLSPLRPAIYQNPDIAKAGVDNSAKLFSDGLKTFPDYAKLPAEVKKILAESGALNALTGLRNAQTTTEQGKPALLRAQTGEANASARLKNRTNPNLHGGGGNPNRYSLLVEALRTGKISQEQFNQAILNPSEIQMIMGGASGASLPAPRPTASDVSGKYGF